ncbi:MAG: S-adenosylmethionine decarboxylase proenzyme [Chlamydiae bacterium]|nr:S-adenosylmethionine decarboxylase proenzyme [Chlamydiota bacterium]
MKFLLAILLACLATFAQADVEYEFIGRHLIVSYLDCNHEAIMDEEAIKEKMKEAAVSAGVTILSSSHHHFAPKGVTQVLLLSESHASIHTYPEVRSCFVDLFTCGTTFALDKFDKVMSDYLKPKNVSHTLLHRQKDCKEMAFVPIEEETRL